MFQAHKYALVTFRNIDNLPSRLHQLTTSRQQDSSKFFMEKATWFKYRRIDSDSWRTVTYKERTLTWLRRWPRRKANAHTFHMLTTARWKCNGAWSKAFVRYRDIISLLRPFTNQWISITSLDMKRKKSS